MGHVVSRADMPAVHGLQMIELAERWNVTPREVLKGLGITMEMLSDPSGRLSIAQVESLVERTCALTGEPGLGFYMGLQMRLSMHGYLGFATMMASTVSISRRVNADVGDFLMVGKYRARRKPPTVSQLP